MRSNTATAPDGPPVGSTVEDKTGNVGRRFVVLDVQLAPPGTMTLGWTGYRADLDEDGEKAQVFTLRDWRKRWRVVHEP